LTGSGEHGVRVDEVHFLDRGFAFLPVR